MSISNFLRRKFLKSLFFPSHNRGQALPSEIKKLLKDEPGIWDLPELPELGSVLSDSGLIYEAQNYFSRKFSVNNCWFGVNGASGLIQSAILAIAKPGDYLLMPRNIHISVIKICILSKIKPVFFDLEFSERTGKYLPITKEWLITIFEHSLLKEIELSGIVLVNPTYDGFAFDINPIIEICHQYQLPVLVDEAHGAYFLFCENYGLPQSAVRAKADLVVHSLHKSLNGLTQTAILWHSGNNIKKEIIERSINLLQTTSPNSLLLSSCEESLKDWLNNDNLIEYKQTIDEARNIFNELSKRGLPLLKNQDPLKIILNVGEIGIDGFSCDEFFYKNGLIAELPELMSLTFCLGFAKQDNFVDAFEHIWKKFLLIRKTKNKLKLVKPPFKLIQIPEFVPSEAWFKKSIKVPIKESLGRISAEIFCPYPPGIPLLVPGEKIDKKRVDWLLSQILYNKDLVNSYISVLET